MKPIVLFQCGTTQSTVWDDATQIWNNQAANHGFWVTSADAQSYLYHYKKQQSGILFSRSESNKADFKLTKPHVREDMADFKDAWRNVDIGKAIDWLNGNKGKALGFGSFLSNKPNAHIDIIQNAVYYTRDPWMGGHVKNINNNKFITDDDNDVVTTLTFFYAYKMTDYPVYIFVFNPDLVTLGNDIEFENDKARYRTMSNHENTWGDQLLKPKMSKNAFPLEDKWYVVKGQEFEFEPSAFGSLNLAYGFIFDKAKIMTDLDIEKIGPNKYKARFKDGQYSSYISIRVNTGNALDWTFINSGNRLVYNIMVQRNYEE